MLIEHSNIQSERFKKSVLKNEAQRRAPVLKELLSIQTEKQKQKQRHSNLVEELLNRRGNNINTTHFKPSILFPREA